MKRFFNPCRRYRQDICLLADGALTEPERNQVEEHLAACADCRKYCGEIEAVTGPLTNWEDNFAQLQPGQPARMRWARAIEAAGGSPAAHRRTPARAFREWWRDVILPARRAWTGLAAVWAVLLAGNVLLHEYSPTPALKYSRPSSAMVASFKNQEKILAELLTDRFVPREAHRPRYFPPKPRTEHIVIVTV